MSKQAAQRCFRDAGLRIGDVDVIEVHDCFAPNEVTNSSHIHQQIMMQQWGNVQLSCRGEPTHCYLFIPFACEYVSFHQNIYRSVHGELYLCVNMHTCIYHLSGYFQPSVAVNQWLDVKLTHYNWRNSFWEGKLSQHSFGHTYTHETLVVVCNDVSPSVCQCLYVGLWRKRWLE